MLLHVVRNSHNCRRVLATVAQLGLDIEISEPNLAAGEIKTPEYLAINPNGKVPALMDGELKLWESNAIMQYLADKSGDTTLWPGDAAARANVARWQFWEANHLSRGTGALTFEKVFKPFVLKQETNPETVAEAEVTFHKFAPVLNGALEGTAFLTGKDLTLADFSVAADFSYAAPAGFPLEDYSHIRSWLGRMDEVEAWAASAPKL
jgi:glutathione S-transferase